METIQTLLYVLQVLVAVALVGFILIQHGKGADAGAAFGSGASATVFGSSGSSNFMTKATTILAVVFLANSLGLSYIATKRVAVEPSLMQQQQTQTIPEGPGPVTIPVTADELPETPASSDQASDIPAIPEE